MRAFWWSAVVVAAAGLGCNHVGPPPAATSGQAAPDIKRRELSSLPAVGEYSPPLDGGRLEAAPPVGWNVLPRGKTFLIGFAKGKASELPRIVVQAQAAPAEFAADLDEANVAAFAAAEDNQLRAGAKAGKKTVTEYNLPLVLGSTMFVRHVRQARLGDTPCVIQSLQTVRDGRLYTVELIATVEAARSEEYDKSLTKWRDQAYAVAANLRFTSADQSANSPTGGEPAAEKKDN